MPLFFSRYYDSFIKSDGNITSSLGDNWLSNFDMAITQNGSAVQIITNRGRLIQFQQNGASWDLTGKTDIAYQLVRSGKDFILGDPYTGRMYTFAPDLLDNSADPFIIDDFLNPIPRIEAQNQDGTFPVRTGTTVEGSMLGGEFDVLLVLDAVENPSDGAYFKAEQGRVIFNQDDTSTGRVLLIWDGVDGDAVRLVARTGPGMALDGKPKFNLKKFNPTYFERLQRRVSAARGRGIYVSVMLFEGWAMQFSTGAWESHPFHQKNNINGINGDQNKGDKGLEFHTLADPAVTALQEAYVRKVIDTVNDFDNVLYEISNENHPPSTEWQYHMIRYIKSYEKSKPKRHPVGMTFQYRGGKNESLFKSPADWISPNREGGYRDNPPAADGRKVVLNDTDHLWGIGGNQAWVWKSFLRGHNPIFMDPYDGVVLGKQFDPKWDPIRRSMGYTRMYADRMNLAAMQPCDDLASTKYCLAKPGVEYLVFKPVADESSITVKLKAGKYKYEWFDPSQGKVVSKGTIRANGGEQVLISPLKGDAVVYITHAK